MIEKRHEQAGHITHEDGTGSDPKTGKKTGVYSALRIKGLSQKVKDAAGNFGNQTTEMVHPVTKQKMRVIVINRQHS